MSKTAAYQGRWMRATKIIHITFSTILKYLYCYKHDKTNILALIYIAITNYGGNNKFC